MNLTLFFNWHNIRHSLLVIFGFLLSPLCWWNDLIVNLPIAYGFGKIVSFFSPNFFIPASIFGYWLTNIIGIILMQLGTTNLINDSEQKVDLKKNILSGFATSTVFTIAIVVLWKTNILNLSLPSFLTTPLDL